MWYTRNWQNSFSNSRFIGLYRSYLLGKHKSCLSFICAGSPTVPKKRKQRKEARKKHTDLAWALTPPSTPRVSNAYFCQLRKGQETNASEEKWVKKCHQLDVRTRYSVTWDFFVQILGVCLVTTKLYSINTQKQYKIEIVYCRKRSFRL